MQNKSIICGAFANDSLPIGTDKLEVRIMSSQTDRQSSPFVKIVYSKVKVNGKTELVPMELYADGSLKRTA